MSPPPPTDTGGGVFGERVTAILVGKGIGLPEELIAATAIRLINRPGDRRYALEYLSRKDFSLADVQATARMPIQRLLDNLARHGGAGVGLPHCPACNIRKVLPRRDPSGTQVCLRCFERSRYAECSRCLRMKKVSASTEDGLVCERCSSAGAVLTECPRCSKLVAATASYDGVRICLNCYPAKLRTCHGCGTEAKIAATVLGGPHCMSCYNKIKRKPSPCPRCHQPKVLAFLSAEQQPICASCAGQFPRFACRRCGSEENAYGRLCALCMLRDRAHEVLSTDDGSLAAPMTPLFDHLLAKPYPAVTLKWLNRGRHTELLRDLARGRLPLTNEAFAAVPPDKALSYLRSLLAATGVLEQPALSLTRLEEWIERFQSELDPRHEAVLAPYIRWVILRRARTAERDRDFGSGGEKHAKAAIRGIQRFLEWLDQQPIAIEDLTQPVVEEFMAEHSSTRWLPPFLTWIAERHTDLDITIPAAKQSSPLVTLDEAAQRQLIHRLIEDDDIPLDARLAALFVAVFAQPAARVVSLHYQHLTLEDQHVGLTLQAGTISLPAAMASLARSHLNELHERQTTTWLFPGRTPGGHRNEQYIAKWLKQIGTSISQLQNTARFQLAGTLPAKILADTLGFNTSTFEKYARLSNGTWAEYPALRAKPTAQQNYPNSSSPN